MSTSPLTPQERLALSRKAIFKHMNRHEREHGDEGDLESNESAVRKPSKRGTLGVLTQAIRVWWFRHPASSAVELARPLLGDYARAHPFKLLGAAAGLGAAAVLVRPWRMVSIGGLLVAAVKSSGLSGVLFSLLTNRSDVSHNDENNQNYEDLS